MSVSQQLFVRQVIERNRYLTLATCDAQNPWAAPLEYVSDDHLNLYFFSPEHAAHSTHIASHPVVAVAIFDAVQPEYEPAEVIRIAGVQLTATAQKLEMPFPRLVADKIAAWNLPMPPYAAFKITPEKWFVPVLNKGINERLEVNVATEPSGDKDHD
jgi:uncharacterized protein YhbP (UPF0306 family)